MAAISLDSLRFRSTQKIKMKTGNKLLVGLIAVTAITEISLRLIWGFGNPALIEKEPTIGYVFRANQHVHRFGRTIAINRFHQRSADVGDQPDAGTLRILFVGDSVTFGGTPIDQRQIFTELIKDRLSADGNVEVLNASAGGWGIGNEEAYLEKFHTFGSAWVILEIGSNDFLQDKNDNREVGRDADKPDRRPISAIGELFFRYLLPRFITLTPPPSEPESANPAGTFAQNMKWLNEEVALAKKTGAKVAVIHVPERDEVVAGTGKFETKYDGWRGKLLNLCREQSVPALNLFAIWKADPNVPLYFRDEHHLTVEGNKAVADQFVPFFKALSPPLTKTAP
jgi:lysophospholipase L1-like esterase